MTPMVLNMRSASSPSQHKKGSKYASTTPLFRMHTVSQHKALCPGLPHYFGTPTRIASNGYTKILFRIPFYADSVFH